ncbi:MAG: hypothetical protein FWE17_01025 [Alphaproteobacteria bacterium]|nr:hypothetical protein [Alphaproteobacteria bacterium]MCL2758197.1 hypothetical protein [Alphaproteobacteria bacterium]
MEHKYDDTLPIYNGLTEKEHNEARQVRSAVREQEMLDRPSLVLDAIIHFHMVCTKAVARFAGKGK